MPSTRKRALRDIEPELSSPIPDPDTTAEWIFLFGKVVKIDESIDIDVFETECLKPRSTVLVNVGLALLKFVSSHRGLTPELFDEYTRRQYVAKRPQHNPFGTEEEPARFNEFDIFTRLRVLQQLTQWVMLHPERIREKMDEQKPSDQTEWRIEPFGWDGDEREYYLLDDDRLYRRTEIPPTPAEWKPKKNSKKAKAAARAAKRRRISRSATAADTEEGEDGAMSEHEEEQHEDDGFGGAKWECIAVTLEELQAFLKTIQKTRDENEKILRARIEEGLVPILAKRAESQKRKALAREKELLSLEKMAYAKRSSRLAGRAEKQKQEEESRQEEERRRREEAAARKEEQQRIKREKERDNRLFSREKRLQEREVRRIKHEEELAQLSEDSRNTPGDGSGRLSERRVQVEIAKNKQALQELEDEEEEEDWFFDCICGVYGQVDDGTHSIACERCNVWQHSKCLGFTEEEADRDGFQFICSTCKKKEANPRPTVIKFKVKDPANPSSSSPPTARSVEATPHQHDSAPRHSNIVIEIPRKDTTKSESSPSSVSQVGIKPSDGIQLPRTGSTQQPVLSTIPVKQSGHTPILPPPSPYSNGEGANPFSSPHPTLSPPEQSPNKSRAYSTINQSSSPPIPSRIGEHRSLPPKGVFHVSPRSDSTLQHQRPLVTSLPPHADVAVPSVAARSDSPLKQPLENAFNSVSAIATPSVSFSGSGQLLNANATSPILSTPQLQPSQPGALSNKKTPALPPTQNGISPLKRSPPPAQQPANGPQSTPAPSILPPATALPPSPSQQILTPPTKSVEPVRPASQPFSGPA